MCLKKETDQIWNVLLGFVHTALCADSVLVVNCYIEVGKWLEH